jgi:predicted ATPase
MIELIGIHELRTKGGKSETSDSSVIGVASEYVRDSPLICFDEFQVTNIADAMLLNRLFGYHFLFFVRQ